MALSWTVEWKAAPLALWTASEGTSPQLSEDVTKHPLKSQTSLREDHTL